MMPKQTVYIKLERNLPPRNTFFYLDVSGKISDDIHDFIWSKQTFLDFFFDLLEDEIEAIIDSIITTDYHDLIQSVIES